MTYRLELQRPLRTLAAVEVCGTAYLARRAFRELLPKCRHDGMLIVIHNGHEISPRELMDHAIQEAHAK